MRQITALTVIIAALCSQPAWACRVPISSAKFRIADVVVDGVAHCLKKRGQCNLKVLHLRKGYLNRGRTVRIVVDDAPPPQPHDPGVIIVGHCPQTFEPDAPVNRGRFYLRERSDGSLYAFVPPDLQETEN